MEVCRVVNDLLDRCREPESLRHGLANREHGQGTAGVVLFVAGQLSRVVPVDVPVVGRNLVPTVSAVEPEAPAKFLCAISESPCCA